ncbi:MAG: hypothetical protein ABIG95_00540 [Candidatus Woesearchaeota archaeon]
MKITNQKIYETVARVMGEDVVPLVKYLQDRKNVSEFKIAEQIKIEVNKTRSMLYKLHGHNLVTYQRKKDRQKGWYISYWTFNKKKVRDLLSHIQKDELSLLKDRLKKEADHNSFFICPSLCVRLDFEHATSFDYRCPECGQLLKQQDNSKTIKHLKTKIKQLETQV